MASCLRRHQGASLALAVSLLFFPWPTATASQAVGIGGSSDVGASISTRLMSKLDKSSKISEELKDTIVGLIKEELGAKINCSQSEAKNASTTQSEAKNTSTTQSEVKNASTTQSEAKNASTTSGDTRAAKPPVLIKNPAKCRTKHDDQLTEDSIKVDTVVGTLDCKYCPHSEAKDDLKMVSAEEVCPDNFSKGKVYVVAPTGDSECEPIARYNAGAETYVCTDCAIPKRACRFHSQMTDVCKKFHRNKAGSGIITKVEIHRPKGTGGTVAGVLLKRIAPCEIMPDGSGEKCHAVYKVGTCIDCKSVKNPCDWKEPWLNPYYALNNDYAERHSHNWAAKCSVAQGTVKFVDGKWRCKEPSGRGAKEWGCMSDQWFRGEYASNTHDPSKGGSAAGPPSNSWDAHRPTIPAELKNWASHCVAAAFTPDGKLKPEFECSREPRTREDQPGKTYLSDYDRFKEALKAF